MLIGALGIFGQVFLAIGLALRESLILCGRFFHRQRFLKQRIVEIGQVLFRAAGREDYALQIVGTRVHFYLQDGGHAHLILQNSLAPFATADQMPSAAGRAFEHHQSDLIFLAQDQFLVIRRLLLIVTVDIVEEEAADVLAACQAPIDGSRIVGQLQQMQLRLLVAIIILLQVSAVQTGIAESHQLSPVLDGAGQLMPGPVEGNVVYHSVVFVCVVKFVCSGIVSVSSRSARCRLQLPPTSR